MKVYCETRDGRRETRDEIQQFVPLASYSPTGAGRAVLGPYRRNGGMTMDEITEYSVCEESDPYVAEIRAVRARLNKTANYDVATLAKHTADAVRSIGIQYCGLKPLKPQFDLLAGSAG